MARSRANGRSGAAALGPFRIVMLVLAPFGGGYFFSLFFRSINAVIAPDLVAEFGLSASALGLMTASYFLAFGLFQLPLGVLLDRYGPRRVQGCLLLVAAAGALLFAAGPDLAWLILGRALIGLGVAGGLMAAYKAMVLWLPKERLPLANGMFLAIGGLGALAATAPAQAALAYLSWRQLFVAAALGTAAAGLLIFAAVPERGPAGDSRRLSEQLREMRAIFASGLFWRYAPLTAACFAVGTSVQGLWAASWLSDVAGLDRPTIARYLLAMALALIAGSAFGGVLSDRLGRFGLDVRHVIAAAAVLFIVAQLGTVLGLVSASLVVWVLFAFSYNAVTLSYAALSQRLPAHLSGRVNTGLNLVVIAGTFACQYALGVIIDLWPRDEDGSYPLASYQAAFGAMLAVETAALGWYLFRWGDRA